MHDGIYPWGSSEEGKLVEKSREFKGMIQVRGDSRVANISRNKEKAVLFYSLSVLSLWFPKLSMEKKFEGFLLLMKINTHTHTESTWESCVYI